VQYEVTNPLTQISTARLLGLRAKDIPRAMWAIVPYSFMVDRVIDISSGINGFVNLVDPRIRILAASVTRKKETVHTYTFNHKYDDGWSQLASGGPRVIGRFTYKRSLWVPTVLDAIPMAETKRLVDSTSKILDLATLISQRWRQPT
jgi:hypothetical protein